jgi:23S rRNA (uridine2552-2'-O)-methyltransferase
MPKPYIPNDAWSKRAALEGYRARSVYKLMELDARFKLLRPIMTVLDVGAAPGSWLQYTAEKIGARGKVIGIDLQDMAPIGPNVSLHRADITDTERIESILKSENALELDLVLSDIAPNTSGVKDVDQWRSIELTQAVMNVAKKHLKPGGKCVCKIFRGADFDEFLGELKRTWKEVKMARVEASRDRSREVYLIATKV